MAASFLDKMQERIFYIKGVPFFDPIFYPKKHTEDAIEYEPRDGDLILASYPKTGSTWTQFIILQLMSKGKSFPSIEDALKVVAPMIELVGVDVINELKEPRFYRHHLPYHILKKNDKSKVVYVYRNPEDSLVSMHRFFQDIIGPTNFDEFFESYISPYMGYGRYLEHVKSYYDHKGDKNLLMVSYEKLMRDTKNEIKRIATFIGKEYEKNLKDDPGLLDAIMEKTSFENMKKNLKFIHPSGSLELKINFFRKGTSGDGKCQLSPEQSKRMSEVAENVLGGTEIFKEWYN